MKRQLSATERVHPYVEAPPLHYPSVESYAGSQHEIHMPHDLMQKEQKKELIEQSSLAEDEGFNQETQMETTPLPPQSRHRKKRHGKCVRCCCCVGACVGTIVVILGILTLLFFLVLHPNLPKYTITEASISKLTLSNSTSNNSTNSTATIASAIIGVQEEKDQDGTVYLNVVMQLTARMRNPNKKIGIDYRELTGNLYYEGVEIGEGSVPPFYQPHKNTTYVGLTLQGQNIALTSSLANTLTNTLNNDDSIVLHARAITLVRIKIGHWKSHTSKVRVKCTVQLSNPTRGSVRLLHDSCKFKLLRLHL